MAGLMWSEGADGYMAPNWNGSMPPSRVNFIAAGWGHSLAWALETQKREFAKGERKKKEDQVGPLKKKKKERYSMRMAKWPRVETPLDGAWTLAGSLVSGR